MLNILNQPEKSLRGLLIARAPDLYTKRRNDKLLVIRPDLGTWTIFDEQFQSFYKKIDRPILYQDFIINDQGIPPAMFTAFLEEAFRAGIILLSGRQFGINGGNSKTLISVSSQRTFTEKNILDHAQPKNPRLIILSFEKCQNRERELADSLDYFSNFIEDRLEKEDYEDYHIYLSGNVPPLVQGLEDFFKRIICKSDDLQKKTNFSMDIAPMSAKLIEDNLGNNDRLLLDESTERLPITFNYFLDSNQIKNRDLTDNNKHLKFLANHAKVAEERGIRTAIIVSFHEPEEILPLLNFFLEKNFINIALKIAPEVYMANDSVTESIRKMEALAEKYLSVLDEVTKIMGTGHTRFILHDFHRFICRVAGKRYDFPCGSSPCGMGEQILFVSDTEKIFACRPSLEKSRERLIMTVEDVDCPSKSLGLSFWKQNRLELSPRCKRCIWRKFCGAGCPVITYEKYGDLSREDPRCRFFQKVFEELIWKVYDSPLLIRKFGGIW